MAQRQTGLRQRPAPLGLRVLLRVHLGQPLARRLGVQLQRKTPAQRRELPLHRRLLAHLLLAAPGRRRREMLQTLAGTHPRRLGMRRALRQRPLLERRLRHRFL